MITTVLFDLDGTLADTAGDFIEAINIMRRRREYPPFDADKITPWVSKGGRAMLNATVPIPLPPSNADIALDEFHAVYAHQKHARATIFGEVADVIKKLEDSGLYWGVVTNKYRALTMSLLEKLDIHPHVLVCGDDVEKGKPDPAGLILACGKLGTRPYEMAYVGDAERDIMAADKAGAVSIVAGWGYIPEWEDTDNWKADCYADTPTDIFDFI